MFKFKIKKVMASVVAAATVAVGVNGLNVSAETVKTNLDPVLTEDTSQHIMITSQGYIDTYSPAGGVYVDVYGVRGFTQGHNNDSTITTNFTITGNLHNETRSDSISKTGTNVEICDYSKTTSIDYDYCDSTVSTTSSVYGTSTQICNFAC